MENMSTTGIRKEIFLDLNWDLIDTCRKVTPSTIFGGRRPNMKTIKVVLKRIGQSLYGWTPEMVGSKTNVFNVSGRVPGFRWNDVAWIQAQKLRANSTFIGKIPVYTYIFDTSATQHSAFFMR